MPNKPKPITAGPSGAVVFVDIELMRKKLAGEVPAGQGYVELRRLLGIKADRAEVARARELSVKRIAIALEAVRTPRHKWAGFIAPRVGLSPRHTRRILEKLGF
jgi:hypothetical protein